MNELQTMLVALETATLFITGTGVMIAVIVFNIGAQRSFLNGLVFAGFVLMAYGTLFYQIIAGNRFITGGLLIIAIGLLLSVLMAKRSPLKVGGMA